MAHEPAEYQKVQIKQFAPRALRETAEGKYWRRFKAPIVSQQIGAVSHIDFCQQHPYDFAVTASTRVILHNGVKRDVKRTIGRFKDKAYSGTFRADGKLIVAGGEDGMVQIFDVNSRAVLRQLKGHQRPVHVTRFSSDRVHVLSGSDDVTVRWWDVTVGKQVSRLTGHTDYVRAAAASPVSVDTWATGGYDHTVRLWDIRSREVAFNVDHGAPVEDVAFFPSGSLLATAGGSFVCIWDVLNGGRLLKKLSNFQKTVTSLMLSPCAGPDSTAAPRLLAASLDSHLKIFELDTFKVTHASRYASPILSMGLSPDCSTLAVGCVDGTLSVRRHMRTKPAGSAVGMGGAAAGQRRRQRYPERLTASSYRFFLRGQSTKAAADDYRVAARRRAHLTTYDRYLRQFRYRDALDAALSTQQPEVVASILQELSARGGLPAALGNRDAESLIPLLRHTVRYIADPRHSRLLTGVAHRIIDTYAPVVGQSPEVDRQLELLRERVVGEMKLQSELQKLQGCLEPIFAAAMAHAASLPDSL